MPKGYWIPQIDISNQEGYKAYMAATPPAHEKYHGVALIRGGKMEVVEGHGRGRCVLREFPDFAAALASCPTPKLTSRIWRPTKRHSANSARGIWCVAGVAR